MATNSTQHNRTLTGSNRTERVFANHFTCSFLDNTTLYQYDLAIEVMNSISGDWMAVRSRSKCSLIMQSLIRDHQLNPREFVWHDEQKYLYSTCQLSTPLERMSDDGQSRFRITTATNKWSTNDLYQYLNGQTTSYPKDAVRILETLLKRSLQDRIRIVNRTCYFLDSKPEELGNGFERRKGFTQALHLSSNTLTLNIQTKLKTFYSPVPLLDFIRIHSGVDTFPSNFQWSRLNRILQNCLVVTAQSNWKKVYEFYQFDHRRPGDIYIESGISLIEYYSRLGIQLKDLEYPCIEVYPPGKAQGPCHLPLEVCRIEEWQTFEAPTIDRQPDDEFIPSPQTRYDDITKVLSRCNYNSNTNLLCQAVQFKIECDEMLELTAKILVEPKVLSGDQHYARIHNGHIYVNGQLLEPKLISKLAVAYFGTQYKQNVVLVQRFCSVLRNKMEAFQIVVGQFEFSTDPIENTKQQINDYFQSKKEEKYDLLVCIMHDNSANNLTQLKHQIKLCGTLYHGIMTQCVLFTEIPNKDKTLQNYCETLLRKINFKNGGINSKVIDIDQPLKNRCLQKDSIMFIGADVIHPTNVTRQHPSIAALVAAADVYCTRTAARICKQYPKDGKCSIERIVGMSEMVQQLLDYYYQTNGKLPTKVMFYRDGVDNAQFETVRKYEVEAIRKAFTNVYGSHGDLPSLTLIIVQKRHHTRFFTYNENSEQSNNNNRYARQGKPVLDETGNMSIGAVVDSKVTDDGHVNFFLNSHNAFQGVNRPAHYHVLVNEIGLTVQDLQKLTFYLCFTDGRSSAAEAIPSVLHQADLAALKARDLFCYDNDLSTATTERRSVTSQNPAAHELSYEMLPVHEELKNRPVFG